MLNEDRNKAVGWKQALDSLDTLPGDMLNKTAAWEKLHARLSDKPVNRRRFWYWVAAACLLLIFSLSTLMRDTSKPSFVKNNPGQNDKAEPVVQVPMEKEIAITPTPSNPQKKHEPFSVSKNKMIPTNNNVERTEQLKTEETTVTNQPLVNNENDNYKHVDTIAVAAAIIPTTKKKLRVIHLNELGQPAEEKLQYVRNNTPNILLTEPPYKISSALIMSRNASDDILKIKLSSSN